MSKRPEIQINLIPAARSEWEKTGRLQGQSDLPANPESLAEMRAILDAVDSLTSGPILSAPDEASLETARLVHDITGGKIKPIEALAEPSLGLWEGLEESAAMERYASAFKQWRNDPASVIPPEGESFEDAVDRIVGGVIKAIDKTSKPVVSIVVRPVAYQILQRWAMGRPIAEDWRGGGADIVFTFSLPRTKLPDVVLKTPAVAK